MPAFEYCATAPYCVPVVSCTSDWDPDLRPCAAQHSFLRKIRILPVNSQIEFSQEFLKCPEVVSDLSKEMSLWGQKS